MLKELKNTINHVSIDIQKQIVKTFLDVVPGTTFVDESIHSERLNFCVNECERFNEENRKCRECGCFVDYKTRVHSLPFVGVESCPLKKW